MSLLGRGFTISCENTPAKASPAEPRSVVFQSLTELDLTWSTTNGLSGTEASAVHGAESTKGSGGGGAGALATASLGSSSGHEGTATVATGLAHAASSQDVSASARDWTEEPSIGLRTRCTRTPYRTERRRSRTTRSAPYLASSAARLSSAAFMPTFVPETMSAPTSEVSCTVTVSRDPLVVGARSHVTIDAESRSSPVAMTSV